jgi:hypothetical protein
LHDRAATAEGRLITFSLRLQQRVDAFRVRKEVLKPTYTVAGIERMIDDALAALEKKAQAGSGAAAEVAGKTARSAIVGTPRQIRAAVRAFNQEI